MPIYQPGERIYPDLDALKDAWSAIPPSHDRKIAYRPCSVRFKDGRSLDCVYVVPAQSYIDTWGIWPEDLTGKPHVSISDVIEIHENPYRLPPAIASRIYKAGESGMGYFMFALLFRDGTEQAYVTGNAVDFVKLPLGKSAGEIVDVKPHKRADSAIDGLDYYWCLFGRGKSNAKIEYFI